jgi:hypothetical protein
LKRNYICHGPKGFGKTTDTIDDFIKFVAAFGNIFGNIQEIENRSTWEFDIVSMSEEEFNNLPEFEGF